MLMRFKTELRLNDKERSKLAQCAGIARHAYNLALSLTKSVLDWNEANATEKIPFPGWITLNNWITTYIKPEFPWYYDVSSQIPTCAVRHLRDAWKRFFQGLAKPPKFKKKGKHDAFSINQKIYITDSRKIQIPKLGILDTFENLPQGIPTKSATIYSYAGKWFISLLLDLPVQPTKKTNLSVGVDLGIKNFATLSNGEIFSVPVTYKRIKDKIEKLQFLNRHKLIGSKSWRKAQDKIKRLYYRLSCIRKDWLDKLTSYLAKNFEVICIEDLNVQGMIKNRRLSKSIAELGWFEFRRQLTYKCQWYGSTLKILDRWCPSSQIHHACNYRNHNLKLGDRVFYCPICNTSIDRDLNAALNIQRFGLG